MSEQPQVDVALRDVSFNCSSPVRSLGDSGWWIDVPADVNPRIHDWVYHYATTRWFHVSEIANGTLYISPMSKPSPEIKQGDRMLYAPLRFKDGLDVNQTTQQ